jgi:hypothetical protein
VGVLNIFVSFDPKSAYPCTVTFLPFWQDKFLDFFRKNSILNIYLQIWFIGRTLASQAGKAGSIPVICFFDGCENPCKCWIFPLFTRVSGVFGASTTKAYFSIKNPFFWGNITRNITRKRAVFPLFSRNDSPLLCAYIVFFIIFYLMCPSSAIRSAVIIQPSESNAYACPSIWQTASCR